MMRFILLLGLPLLAFGMALPANAACSKRYTLYVVEVGYYYYTENDKDRGLLPDLMAEAQQRSGCQLEVAALSFQRLHVLMQAGKAELVGPRDLGNVEREIPDGSIPMLREQWFWIVRRGSGVRGFADIRSAGSNVVGAVQGASYGDWWNQRLQRLPPGRLEWTSTPESALRKVAEGHNGATPGSILAYGHLMEQLNLRQKLDLRPQARQPPIFIGIGLEGKDITPQDKALLSRTLRQIRDDGSWEAIVARYVGPQLARQLVFHPSSRRK